MFEIGTAGTARPALGRASQVQQAPNAASGRGQPAPLARPPLTGTATRGREGYTVGGRGLGNSQSPQVRIDIGEGLTNVNGVFEPQDLLTPYF